MLKSSKQKDSSILRHSTSKPALPTPIGNHILSAISDEEQLRLFPQLTLEYLTLGRALSESGEIVQHVYFPVDAVVSLLYVMENGASAEISVVGNEGLVGIALFMGGGSTLSRSVVQIAGYSYRLSAKGILSEFNQHGPLSHILLRYTQSLLTQMAQTAVCNRHHTIDQQLCRWLLLSLDRLQDNHIRMTQELIANMLGVRREGVTEAAGKLQKSGIIKDNRGHNTILDRPSVEQLS
jgi:CRP-like cAMP-binding protein